MLTAMSKFYFYYTLPSLVHDDFATPFQLLLRDSCGLAHDARDTRMVQRSKCRVCCNVSHRFCMLTTSRSSVEIIRGAHDEAVAIFTEVLTEDERKRIWCGNYLSMKDVLDAVNTSKAIYESKPNSKARKWLSILSSRVTHYGGIMDILVQHHPEYTSFAWGAMKFLFIVCLQEAEVGRKLLTANDRL